MLHIFQGLIDTKVSPWYLRHYNDFILLHVLLQLHFLEYSIEERFGSFKMNECVKSVSKISSSSNNLGVYQE